MSDDDKTRGPSGEACQECYYLIPFTGEEKAVWATDFCGNKQYVGDCVVRGFRSDSWCHLYRDRSGTTDKRIQALEERVTLLEYYHHIQVTGGYPPPKEEK